MAGRARGGARPRRAAVLAFAAAGLAFAAGLAAAAAGAQPGLDRDGLSSDGRDPGRPARAAVFRAPGFPTADAPAISDATLAAALAGLPAHTLGSVAALAERLDPARYDVLVLPYGSAFPLAAWPSASAASSPPAAGWWCSAARRSI